MGGLLAFLSKIGLGFLAGLIRGLVSDWRRDEALKDQGRHEVYDESDDAADERKKLADAAQADWDSLSDDERERVRNAQGHYRD